MKVRILATNEVVEVQDFGEHFHPRYWAKRAVYSARDCYSASEVEVIESTGAEKYRSLVLKTSNSKEGEEFIAFFRGLIGKKWIVANVGLSGLSARNTTTVVLRVEQV